jgi:hypothetical protein
VWKEAVVAYFNMLSRHLCGGTEKNNENRIAYLQAKKVWVE